MTPKWQKLASLAQEICTLQFHFFGAVFASKGYPFKNILSPPVKYFYWPFQGFTSFVDHLCFLCLWFVMLLHLFIAALWSPAGKGLTSMLLFVMSNCYFVTFPFGILGQVWYLIVWILELCHLSYIYIYAFNIVTYSSVFDDQKRNQFCINSHLVSLNRKS